MYLHGDRTRFKCCRDALHERCFDLLNTVPVIAVFDGHVVKEIDVKSIDVDEIVFFKYRSP